MVSQCKLEWMKHNMITFLLTESGCKLQLSSNVKPEGYSHSGPSQRLSCSYSAPQVRNQYSKSAPDKSHWDTRSQISSSAQHPLSLQKPGSFFVAPLAGYWYWHQLVIELPSHCFAELTFSTPAGRYRMCSGHIIKMMLMTSAVNR